MRLIQLSFSREHAAASPVVLPQPPNDSIQDGNLEDLTLSRGAGCKGSEARKLEQVAQYLSVSVQQVYSLVRSGELPAIKLGGRGVWRVDRAKLDDSLEELERETKEWARAHPLKPREK